MADVTNTETPPTIAEPAAAADSSAVLVTPAPEPVAAAPLVPEAPAAETVEDDDGLSDDPGETEDDELDELESQQVPRHFAAPAMLQIDRLDDDDTFCMRTAEDLAEVSALATDIARLGQLFPIDVRLVPPDRIQVITGFRRVAALKFLQREKVVARLHTELSDSDAMLMALASAIHSRAIDGDALRAVKEKLESERRLTPAARDMIAKALAADDELAPENVEEEVDADELASDVTLRLSQCNQDLSLLADVFDQLDDEKRDALMTQLKYSIELVSFLESKK